MGAGPSTGEGILKKSPLGCILIHWKQIAGSPGGVTRRDDLIKYCNQWWPLYKLEDGEKWPRNGTLNYNTLLQLMLFLRREGKWDEILYADMFFTLRQHPEWQKKCGINLAPTDPLVLALEKDEREREKGKVLKRCCSACSIGQRCLKLTQKEQEEDLEMLVAPGLRQRSQNHGFEPFRVEGESDDESERGATRATPVARRTRNRQGTVLQAPLRQAVGNEGPVVVKVPFSITDLNNWKIAAGNYRDDSDRVASAFEMMIKTQDPDWKDIEVIMQVLFDSTEREMIRKTARTQVEAQIAAGTLQGQLEHHFPSADPAWDPNDNGEKLLLTQYQKWVLFGIRNAIPKAINWSKLYEIKQDKKESPTDFLNKLKEAARKYTTLDPESEEGKSQLATLFIGQSADDIRRKLQKLQGADARDLGKLLDRAWLIYRNRDQQKEKGNARLIAALEGVRGSQGGQRRDGFGGGRHREGRSRGYSRPPLGKTQCAYCRKEGHWKQECPLLQKNGKSETSILNIEMED
ncbi:uncharacterized protein LOC143171928 [Aptenodytes patagonicus]|uniref:uncharacterized protein LOC143171928 n=1 Tax=Aptenodytes patagonicus TaxID=9234 RepID=UPI003F9ECF3F